MRLPVVRFGFDGRANHIIGSLVAIHGLNPVNKEFHAEQTWTLGDKLWLRDFLPSKVPRARVLLFGYNSNVAFETSTAGVVEQAENLLNRLKFKRTVRAISKFVPVIMKWSLM